ncbi:hypothetical protein EDB19DRAFT_717336 [Suillus lakei]|nr:hypothetical protein EDB19DRAFT_717336 [Suillus lakei]
MRLPTNTVGGRTHAMMRSVLQRECVVLVFFMLPRGSLDSSAVLRIHRTQHGSFRSSCAPSGLLVMGFARWIGRWINRVIASVRSSKINRSVQVYKLTIPPTATLIFGLARWLSLLVLLCLIFLPLWEIPVKIDRAHGCRRLDGRIFAAVNCVIDQPVANTDDSQRWF